MKRIGVALSVLVLVGCGNNPHDASSGSGGAGEGGASSGGSTASGEAGHGSNGGASGSGGHDTGAGGGEAGGGIPDTGYVGSVKLQDIGIANYATYVIVDGKAKYWGYAIGGGIAVHPGDLPAPAGVTLTRVSAGGHSNEALDSTGHVWGCGGNIMGEMGIGSVSGTHDFFGSWVATPTDDQGKPFDHVVDIQEGFDGSSALKDDGTLWFWGLNGDDGVPATSPGTNNGMAGICGVTIPTTGCPWGGDPNADPNCYVTRPHQIQFPKKGDGSAVVIKEYAYGFSTPLALDTDGNVWSWGTGALKDGDFHQSTDPVKVSIPILPAGERVVQVASSGSFYYVLASNGHIYGWGSGNGGMYLGIGDGIYTWHPTPTPIDVTAQPGFTALVGKVARLATGAMASYVLDTDGNVWAWGSQVIGSVGNGPTGISQNIGIDSKNNWSWSGTVDMVMKPVKVLSNVQALFVRGYVYNAFAVTKDGKLMAWGRDKFENLGDGCIGDDVSGNQPDACDVGTPESVTPL